jgi:small subunit ribosomal protein S6
MRRYETIVIIDPDLGEEGRAPLVDQVKKLFSEFNGRLVKFDEWGNRKLAYKIRKKPRGHYVRLDYCGTTELVNEMERRFKINDAFLKYMTVLQEKEVDLEAIEAEIADEEKKTAEAREKALLAAEEAQSQDAESAEEAAIATDQPVSEIESGETLRDDLEPEAAQKDKPETIEISTDEPESNKKE